MHKVWLHTLKPPEKLSNEDHHVSLQDTMVRGQGQWDNSVIGVVFSGCEVFLDSPSGQEENTACPQASGRSICSGAR